MNLNVNEWKEFQVGKLFNCTLSAGDLKINDCKQGTIPLISSGQTNNGLVGYIDSKGDGEAQIYSGGKLTVDMFCNAFYQDKDFYAVSHGRVNILEPLFDWNSANLLFISTIINKEKFKYSYGRAVYNGEISRMVLKLPICKNEDGEPIIDSSHKYSEEGYIPDFKWMENYIKTLKYKPLTTANVKMDANYTHLDVAKWKEFKLSSICNVVNGKGITEEEIACNPGELMAIQGGSSNNGCLGKIDKGYCLEQKYKIISEPCLTVARVGSAGYVNFQSSPVAVGDKAKALILKERKTVEIYIFIGTLLNQNIYKYSYGRGVKEKTYMAEILRLPICYEEDGVTPQIDDTHKYSEEGYIPDFKWMENYVKKLPYGDRL